MSFGRALSSLAAVAAVAGCVLLAVQVSHATTAGNAAEPMPTLSTTPTVTTLPPSPSLAGTLPGSTSAHRASRPTTVSTRPATRSAGRSRAASTPAATATPRASTPTPSLTPAPAAKVYRAPRSRPAATSRLPEPPSSAPPAPKPAPAPKATHPPARKTSRPALKPVKGSSLPLHFSTGSASRVITVVASSKASTTARLQAWTKAPGGGWLRHGPSITAHVGSQGLTSSPSESKSATPIGSFTLTRAFGHDPNPGTRLPYLHTNPSDWWISQRGPIYNTLQSCSGRCPFAQGSPNEHLYYETPFYDYAVVIDYNTRNAGPVRQGAGSAFFLHVTDGNPTAGCVSIPMSRLVTIMKWLAPGDHPRILIGVT